MAKFVAFIVRSKLGALMRRAELLAGSRERWIEPELG